MPRVLLNKLTFVLGIVLILNLFGSCSEKTTSCCCKNYIIISTLDGSITALDLYSGQLCWSVVLDPEKFMSSSLSNLEVYESNRRIFLIPSLDGSIYKYDAFKKRIVPLPVNVDTLINHSGYLDPSNLINGGKFKIIHGIHRLTGEIIYTCNVSGCINFKMPFPENMLVVEEVIQIVNAIDTSKAEKRWHFRVVELKIKVASNKNVSNFMDTSNETALIPHIPPKVNDFINVDLYKISLENGFAGMINKTRNEFSWIFKAPAPINDAWIVIDDLIQLLDPFDKESSFYSVDADDGQHPALLFLGIYDNQKFIKRSRKLQLKSSDVTSLAQNYIFDMARIPVCLTEDVVLGPHLEPAGTGLVPHQGHISYHMNDTDHGFYFYANFSIAENATHCIINYTYIMTQESKMLFHNWLALVMIATGFTLFLLSCFIIPFVSIDSKEEVSLPIKSTISVAVSSNDSTITMSSSEEFRSRFHQDFELISVLGKGGFGVVMDVKNKIDDCRYAVKRICLHEELNNFQYEKVLREVKALAKLDHHGIVRYFNAWFEYPPAGWQEEKDKESNICDISKSTFDEADEGSSVSVSRNIKSSHKFKFATPKVLEKLNQNPLQLFNNELFCDNVPLEESKLSGYSSDDDDNSSKHSEENSDSDLSENDAPTFTKYTDDGDDESDSFIQFQNVDLKPHKRKQFTEKGGNYVDELSYESAKRRKHSGKFWKSTDVAINKCTDDGSDSDSFIQFKNELIPSNPETPHCTEKNIDDDDNGSFGQLAGGKGYSDKFKKTMYFRNSSTSQNIAFYSKIAKKHVTCYKNLKILNESLVHSLTVQQFDMLASFIFCDKTSAKSVVDMSNWKNIRSSITKEEFGFYQKWLICILCKIISCRNFTCDVAKDNLCFILSDINDRFYEIESSLYIKSVESQLSVSTKQQKIEPPVRFSKQTHKKNFARGYLYIQMQLCKKESLRDWLSVHSDFRDYNKVMEIFTEIVDAVHYVHSCGLMHRDLKPSNIYFSMEGAIKIGDFGLATSSEINVEQGSTYQPSDIHTSDIGTELYMSPEQKLKQDYDCKTDIYSLGIILFELLVPFKTSSERCTVLLEVRKIKFPEEFKRNFQDESHFVALLLDSDPKRRPTTSEIKQHPVILKFMSTVK